MRYVLRMSCVHLWKFCIMGASAASACEFTPCFLWWHISSSSNVGSLQIELCISLDCPSSVFLRRILRIALVVTLGLGTATYGVNYGGKYAVHRAPCLRWFIWNSCSRCVCSRLFTPKIVPSAIQLFSCICVADNVGLLGLVPLYVCRVTRICLFMYMQCRRWYTCCIFRA